MRIHSSIVELLTFKVDRIHGRNGRFRCPFA